MKPIMKMKIKLIPNNKKIKLMKILLFLIIIILIIIMNKIMKKKRIFKVKIKNYN